MNTAQQKSKRLRNPLVDVLREKLAEAKKNPDLQKNYMKITLAHFPERDTVSGGARIGKTWNGYVMDEELINFWHGLATEGSTSAA
jgi:hypothetical protein